MCDDRLEIHADDAADRGIREDDLVQAISSTGSVLVKVRLTHSIARGVVSLKSGFWQVKNNPDGNVYDGTNTLTESIPTLPSRSSRTHSNAVQIIKNLGDCRGSGNF